MAGFCSKWVGKKGRKSRGAVMNGLGYMSILIVGVIVLASINLLLIVFVVYFKL